MKRTLLTISALLFTTLFLGAQNVPREKVVVEVGTSTTCPYCPGAAMGTADLIANGKEVAVIKYQSGDDYENTYSAARVNYYMVPGFPTAYFDGGNQVVGGSATQSMYPQYLPKYNNRINVTSPFTIDVTGGTSGLEYFEITVTLEKVGTNSSSNLKLHTVVTESDIPKYWQGMDHLDNVCRLMVPNQNGTAVNFTSGNVQTYNLSFWLEEEWIPENCELVIFVQDHSTKEIHQGVIFSLMDFSDPLFDNDAAVKTISGIPKKVCSGNIEPVVKISNHGELPLTSLNINYQVSQGEPQVYNWSGNLNTLESAIIDLPPYAYQVEDDMELQVSSDTPNGVNDDFIANDEKSLPMVEATETPLTVNLLLRTDANPEETTWELKNSDGDVLFSGGPYSTSGQMIQEEFELETAGCYTFAVYDAGGNGFLSPGFYLLYYGASTQIVTGTAFGSEDICEFSAVDAVGVDDPATNQEISVYPNPVNDDLNISMGSLTGKTGTVSVMSIEGRLINRQVYSGSNGFPEKMKIDLSENPSGIYLIQINTDSEVISRKITKL